MHHYHAEALRKTELVDTTDQVKLLRAAEAIALDNAAALPDIKEWAFKRLAIAKAHDLPEIIAGLILEAMDTQYQRDREELRETKAFLRAELVRRVKSFCRSLGTGLGGDHELD